MLAAELQHRAALCLLARPALQPTELRVVEALMPLAEWLWQPVEAGLDKRENSNSGEPQVALFLDAIERLIPAGLATEKEPALLVQVVQWVGRNLFRMLPARLLASMVRHLAFRLTSCNEAEREATGKLVHLEISHVGNWWASTAQPTRRNPDNFHKLIGCAQSWKINEELAMRSDLSLCWSLPLLCGDWSISGFVVTPITSVAQLVEARQHKGVLCSLARGDACQEGREAWFYASPNRLSSDDEICLIGFERATSSDSLWASPVVYGPAGSQEWLERGAAALIARDSAARLRANSSLGVKVSAEAVAGLREMLRSMAVSNRPPHP